MELRKIDNALLPAFKPYLLAEAADFIASGREDILAFGAVTERYQTCGAIAAVLEENTLTVFSLYVDEAVRRRGVATALLTALMEACPDAAVEAVWAARSEEAPAISAFLEKNGFEIRGEDNSLCRFTSSELQSVPLLRRAFSSLFLPAAGVVPLSCLTEEEREELRGDPAIDSRLALDAMTDRMAPELSFCYRREGRVEAYLVCGAPGRRELTVLAVLSREGAPAMAVFHLIAAAVHAALRYFDGEFNCWADTVTEEGRTLVHTLCGEQVQLWQEGFAVLRKE